MRHFELNLCTHNNLPMCRKTISLEIVDEESYEKNLIMYVNIGEPRQIAGEFFVCRLVTILIVAHAKEYRKLIFSFH